MIELVDWFGLDDFCRHRLSLTLSVVYLFPIGAAQLFPFRELGPSLIPTFLQFC